MPFFLIQNHNFKFPIYSFNINSTFPSTFCFFLDKFLIKMYSIMELNGEMQISSPCLTEMLKLSEQLCSELLKSDFFS